MNAIETTKKMAQELTNAGFDVTIKETENSFEFNAMSKNVWYDTTFIFIGYATITDKNRTRKYFSSTRSMAFAKTKSKRNISYSDMYREIDWAIRMSKKVGA